MLSGHWSQIALQGSSEHPQRYIHSCRSVASGVSFERLHLVAQQVALAHARHRAHIHVQVGAADGGGRHSQDGVALHSTVDVLISILATPSLITRLTSCARCRMTAACTAADSVDFAHEATYQQQPII